MSNLQIDSSLRPERNFTIVSNELITDSSITPESKLVLIYLLSKPEKWSAWEADIRKTLDMGRRKYQRIIRELKKSGYIKTTRGGAGGGATLHVTAPNSESHETRPTHNVASDETAPHSNTDLLQKDFTITNSPTGQMCTKDQKTQDQNQSAGAKVPKAYEQKYLNLKSDRDLVTICQRRQWSTAGLSRDQIITKMVRISNSEYAHAQENHRLEKALA